MSIGFHVDPETAKMASEANKRYLNDLKAKKEALNKAGLHIHELDEKIKEVENTVKACDYFANGE